jgi:hypothetical protein
MDRGSSSARAYRLTLGAQAREVDRVRLFDSGPDVRPASIAEQRAFHGRWLASLGTPPR